MNIYDLSSYDYKQYEYTPEAGRLISRNMLRERLRLALTLILLVATVALFLIHDNFWILASGAVIIVAMQLVNVRIYNNIMKSASEKDKQVYHDFIYYTYSRRGDEKNASSHLTEMLYSDVLMGQYDRAKQAADGVNELSLNGYGQFKYFYCRAKLALHEGDMKACADAAEKLREVSAQIPGGARQQSMVDEFSDIKAAPPASSPAPETDAEAEEPSEDGTEE